MSTSMSMYECIQQVFEYLSRIQRLNIILMSTVGLGRMRVLE